LVSYETRRATLSEQLNALINEHLFTAKIENERDEVAENSLYRLELITDFTFHHPSWNCVQRRMTQIDMLQMN